MMTLMTESPLIELVGTSRAARAVGVSPGTLLNWHRDGRATPAYITPGGVARWDVDRLRTELGIDITPPKGQEAK